MATFLRNRKAKAVETTGPTVAFGVLILMLALVMYYIMSTTPEERTRLIGPMKAQVTLLDEHPGVVPAISLSSRSHDLGTILVDNRATAQENILINSQAVSRTVVQDKPAIAFAEIQMSGLASAYLSFTARGNGDLIIAANDQIIYQSYISGFGKVSIPLEILREGRNTFKVSVSSPSYKFWQRNEYMVENFKLTTEKFSDIKADTIQTFSVSAQEASGLQKAGLYGAVSQLSASPARLTIRINEHEIFSAIPRDTLKLDVQTQHLVAGDNKLAFFVEKGGAYRISLAELATSYAPTLPKRYSFMGYEGYTARINAGIFACELKLKKSAGPDALTIQFNDKSLTYRFTNNEVVDSTVCPYIISGTNWLSLFPESSITLDYLSLKLAEK